MPRPARSASTARQLCTSRALCATATPRGSNHIDLPAGVRTDVSRPPPCGTIGLFAGTPAGAPDLGQPLTLLGLGVVGRVEAGVDRAVGQQFLRREVSRTA